MNKIERKSAVVITGLLVLGVLGVLVLSTGIGSELPAIPESSFFFGDDWEDLDPAHLPVDITNLTGDYYVTNEGLLIDPAAPNSKPKLHRDTGRIASIEQFGSVLFMTVRGEEDDEVLSIFGSTAGDTIKFWQPSMAESAGLAGSAGFAGITAGTILDGGDKIVMHSHVAMYDSDNNLQYYYVGTPVLDRKR